MHSYMWNVVEILIWAIRVYSDELSSSFIETWLEMTTAGYSYNLILFVQLYLFAKLILPLTSKSLQDKLLIAGNQQKAFQIWSSEWTVGLLLTN